MKPAYLKPFLIVVFIVLIDQIIKTWVRTNMYIQQDIHFLGDHGMLHYIENNGMAFGMELGGNFGKLVLTMFRIAVVVAIGYGLVYLIKHKYQLRRVDFSRGIRQYCRLYHIWCIIPAWSIILWPCS